MNEKLTPRQNEIISEALAQAGVNMADDPIMQERLSTLQRSLVKEMSEVTRETDFDPVSSNAPSIFG